MITYKTITAFQTARTVLPSLLFLFTSPFANAQEIPLENFIGYPQFNNAKLSPDGNHLALTAEQGGSDLLAIFETEKFSLIATANTSMVTGIEDFHWVSNEEIVYSTQRKYGWFDYPVGTGDLHVMNVGGSKQFIIIGPGAGNFGQYSLLNSFREDDDIVIIQARERGDLNAYPANLNRQYGTASTTGAGRTGTNRLRNGVESPLPFGEIITNHAGEVMLTYQIGPDGTVQLLIRDDASWRALPSFSVPAPESLVGDDQRILRLNADESGLYFISAREGDTAGLALYELASGEQTLLFAHDTYDVSPSNVVWSSDGKEAIGVKLFGQGPESHYFADHPEVGLQQQLDGLFPGQQVLLYDFSDDGIKALAKVTSDTSAPSLFILDRGQGQLQFFSSAYSGLPAELMAPTESFSLKARDGTVLEGYLTRPINSQGPQPLVVLPHSGPHGVRNDGSFDPEVQLLANRGFAVLQLNFRGSGGYGRQFMELGFGNWGSILVDDLVDGTNWAIAEGHAQSQNICIYGHDYGAYAAMMATARYPQLFQCAAAYSGIYDLPLALNSKATYSPWGMPFLKQALGSDEEMLASQSPTNLAGNINVPVLLAHGGFDTRTPQEQFESMQDALDAANVDYDFLLYDREGHGISGIENRTEFYTRLINFLEENLN